VHAAPYRAAHLLPRRMHALSARDDYVRANTSRVAQSVGRIRSLEDLPPLSDDLLVVGANDSAEARTDGSWYIDYTGYRRRPRTGV
jgi:hypothetical protein